MTDPRPLEALASAAAAAANAGRWQEAEKLWSEVNERAPRHPQAQFGLAVHAMRRRDFTRAAVLLEGACASSPNDALARLTLAVVRRETGDVTKELAEIDAALAIDPYFLPALLSKAGWFDRSGKVVSAAFYYAAAIKSAPPEPRWPADLRAQLLHAREVAEGYARRFDDYLVGATAGLRATLPTEQGERWREAAAIMSGRTKPYTAQCAQLHVPRLPAIPFFDVQLFPWVTQIEAKTQTIKAELEQVLARDAEKFTPYVRHKPGEPVNQWEELNHSTRWSSFSLWRHGQAVEENLRLCPQTTKALQEVGMAEIGGLCPNAMFSTLAPHTQIPPHTGETNARVVAHLPLIVPEGCLYRVGYEERRWEVGKVLVFDDTIEHEARNDSDELRVVLIFDIWNPYLAPEERALATTMMEAARGFSGV